MKIIAENRKTPYDRCIFVIDSVFAAMTIASIFEEEKLKFIFELRGDLKRKENLKKTYEMILKNLIKEKIYYESNYGLNLFRAKKIFIGLRILKIRKSLKLFSFITRKNILVGSLTSNIIQAYKFTNFISTIDEGYSDIRKSNKKDLIITLNKFVNITGVVKTLSMLRDVESTKKPLDPNFTTLKQNTKHIYKKFQKEPKTHYLLVCLPELSKNERLINRSIVRDIRSDISMILNSDFLKNNTVVIFKNHPNNKLEPRNKIILSEISNELDIQYIYVDQIIRNKNSNLIPVEILILGIQIKSILSYEPTTILFTLREFREIKFFLNFNNTIIPKVFIDEYLEDIKQLTLTKNIFVKVN